MKYTVVCAHVTSSVFYTGISVVPAVVHVEAANMQEAEYEAAEQYQAVPPKQLRFVAVFEGHLKDLK